MSPHAFFAPIPSPSEYDSWASYRAAAGRWNDFVAVGQKIDHSKNRLAYCIAGQLLRDAVIPSLIFSDPSHTDGFPIGHPDLHLGNIFVDDDLNITMMQNPSPLAAEDLLNATFQARLEQACHIEHMPPNIWKRADMMRLFHRLVRMLSTRDYHDFVALYSLGRCSDGNEEGRSESDEGNPDIPALFAERARQSENMQLLAELREDDSPPDYVKRQEQASILARAQAHPEKLAVARKLTLMSEMNERFVADRKLWRWIEDAMEDIHP
ncbi:be2a466e-a0d6-44d2-9225-397dbde39b44 [Thermothielavioides terrestris]|uniref:Be2a466e-a0d6-44d2-9225-397dbde39b44 n=1 Tax=Thermothielavioides terrestris TaxID=2587410 RepID=A0A3S5CVH9_9PEZI|nr:be2a466e-a0d6-44d2-9225-397dbde39b44 [Thermothielavioides terrestris]